MIKALQSGVILLALFLIGFSVPRSIKRLNNSEPFRTLTGVQTVNHAPVVKIIQPQKNSAYVWNEPVTYSVEVSDKEDGESKYQEIPSSEVLVKLKYVENAVKSFAYLKQKKFSDTTGVMSMLLSNCFSCHAVKTKLAGPSFQDISMRYRNTITNNRQLINHIRKGSSGIWGQEVMPTHSELTDTVAGQMVKWIMEHANDPSLNYFVGMQGILLLNNPGMISHKGIFILSAYYLDHGTNDFPEKRMTGSDWLTFRMLSKSVK